MRVLLIEDDLMIGDAVSIGLKDHAYAVNWVKNGLAIATLLRTERYQAVLLDLGLPKLDGLEVLRRIREYDDAVPVLIITARDDIQQRILALDGGADDYLIKPFDVREMLARLRAVLRRQNGRATPLLGNEQISLNPCSREARKNDVSHFLSAREFSLLRALLLNPGTILSRSELEERLYGWGEEVESNAVEVLIHALRKKLGTDTIKNVRGAGWMVPKK